MSKKEEKIRDLINLEKFKHDVNRDFLVTQHILLATYGFGIFAIIFGTIMAFKEVLWIWVPVSAGLLIIFFAMRKAWYKEVDRLKDLLVKGEDKINAWYKQLLK